MTPTFRRIAGWAAIKAALISVVFTVTFGLYVRDGYHWAQWASSITLMISALVVVQVFVALYVRVREAEPELALIALITGLVGAIGSTVHGAYDVAVLAKPVAKSAANLPSQLDPRGFLAFAVTGIAVGLFGWLVLRTGGLPKLVGQAGLASFVALQVVYFGRLIAVNPHNNVIRVSAVLSGLVLVPAFYLLIARSLLRDEG